MGKKKNRRRRGDDDEEDAAPAEEAAPKKLTKKQRRRLREAAAAEAAEAGGEAAAPAPSGTRKKGKKKRRGRGGDDSDGDDDVDPIAAAMAAAAAAGEGDDDGDDIVAAGMAKKKKKKKKKKGRGRGDADDDDDDDIDPIAAAMAAAAAAEGSDDDGDTIVAAGMAKKKKKNKNKKKKRAAELPEDDDEPLDEDADAVEAADVDVSVDEELAAAVEGVTLGEEDGSGDAEAATATDGDGDDEAADDDSTAADGDADADGAEVESKDDADGDGKAVKSAKGRKPKKLSNKERRRLRRLREREEEAAAEKKKEEEEDPLLRVFSVSQTAVDEDDPSFINATDVHIPSFSITAAKKVLFEDATLRLAAGRKYGFVGPNGLGKSTILRFLAKRMLAVPPRISVLYVEQEVAGDELSAYEAVLRADTTRSGLLLEERDLLAKLEAEDGTHSDEELAAAQARLQEVYDEMVAQNTASAEAHARRILAGLGFTPSMQEQSTSLFSGGWRMRISLARALFMEPDLLLLDEPTNHLDLNAVIWLEQYLQSYEKAMVVVSHDAGFLNNVIEEVIHLHDQKLDYYRGDYDTFRILQEQARKKQMRDWERQEKHKRALKAATSKKQRDIEKARNRRQTGGKKAGKKGKRRRGGEEEKEEHKEREIKRPRDYVVVFTFAEAPELSPPCIDVRNVSFRYPGGPWLFKGITFGVGMGETVAVVGKNGSGKTTLLNVLFGDLPPTKGEVVLNGRLRIGRYAQHFAEQLPLGSTPIEYIRSLSAERGDELSYQDTRNLLGRYGLSGVTQTIKIRDCSGGQKARVLFASLYIQRPHILFLDEPTNHLDIESVEALITAIHEYNGTVILVSHDSRLIEETEARLWMVGDEYVEAFDGGIEEYRDIILAEIEKEEEEAALEKERREAKRRERLEAIRTGGSA